jgi:hypothetical protein
MAAHIGAEIAAQIGARYIYPQPFHCPLEPSLKGFVYSAQVLVVKLCIGVK